ncbi:MAG: hypothetical protein QW136_00540 [Nitrososphaerales archaeon]
MVSNKLLEAIHNVAHVDRSMLPYFCNSMGVHLRHMQLATPDIIPHILVRVEIPTIEYQWRHSRTFAAIVCPDNTIRIVNGNGRIVDTVHVNIIEIMEYLRNNTPTFLDTIVATCANCRKTVGPPGIVDRSGKHHYRHIMCAACAPMAIKSDY